MTPSDQSYREIPLTLGQVAKVDDSDYEWLSKLRWRAQWSKNTKTYYAAVSGGKDVRGLLMHRLILGLERGDKRQGDHHNHDTLDNRRSNLRIATHAENLCNQKRPRNNTTGLKGVYRYRDGRYRAAIGIGGKQKHLGYTKTPEEAHALYVAAARGLYGEFARTA